MEVLGASQHGEYQGLEYQTLPLPSAKDLGPHDVLIQVAFIDVNPVDLHKLHGGQRNYGKPVKDPPFVPGYGGSGTIVEVGHEVPSTTASSSSSSSSSLQRGQPVCFLGDPARRWGSYATHVVVDYRCVAAVPGRVELRDAATIPVAGLTAYESLTKLSLSGHVGGPPNKVGDSGGGGGGSLVGGGKDDTAVAGATKAQQTLLVIGGAGGVGSWAITLARAWYPGLNIVATASTQEQQDWCTSLGATQVMGHSEITQKLKGGREGSVDAILCLTEPTQPLFDACAELIQPYGSICLVVAGKSIESLNLGFVFFKCANVMTQTVFSSIRTNYRNIVPAEELTMILQLMARQTIKAPLSPDLETTVSEDFKDAKKDEGVLKALSNSSGKRRGNLVLRIQGGHDIIFIDLKTASILQVPRRKCIQAKVMHPTTGQRSNEGIYWKEQVPATGYKELVEKITKHPTLGVVKSTAKQVTDYEDGLDMQEAESVQNLWGVKLKKRSKNAKGEEFLFVDPLNGVVGELSRVDCMASGFLVVETESGKEIVKNALADAYQLDEAIATIRKALKMNLEG